MGLKQAFGVYINVQFAAVLRPVLDHYFPERMNVRIIAEPGRYFAASVFTLAVNIIAKRTFTSSDSTSSGQGYCNLQCLYEIIGSHNIDPSTVFRHYFHNH